MTRPRPPQTVLVTGFEPFGGETLNPSWEAARTLDGERLGDAVFAARRLPCVVDDAGPALIDAIEALDPALVLCLGLAGGRTDVSIERVAINIVDARIPDNAGRQPVDEPVVEGGPAAYFSTLPIKAMLRALHDDGIPASISSTAGTYVCNAVFYALSHYAASERPALRGGFIHVPYLPVMATRHAGAPSLALEAVVRAVRVMAATALAVERDIRLAAGSTH
ncbi:pyroglutamyl-peptidase I [Rhizobacter sp. SG703]|uniref:pyroglutamyl-peptidase I n=1 Tax=Rhizobacter sp. SG703 TaxID=2587140 RepID=UPI0014481229|nr:pyroglutamyl-peptidase I [Rhizobacter sp. SG703]NKI96565.1 pyroglutamyl-peptidase [Rhizobacter sp. SG703]